MIVRRLGMYLLLCLFGAGHAVEAAPPPRSPVNPVLAQTYNRLVEGDLHENSLNIEPAMAKLKALEQKDGGNALRYYLLAAGYSATEQWDLVQASLDAGHRAPYCTHYHSTDGPLRIYHTSPVLAQFARRLVAAAPTLDKAKATSLLHGFRKMGVRIAKNEPLDLMTVLLGLAMRSLADKGLAQLLPAGTVEGDATQKMVAADESYRKTVLADARKHYGQDFSDKLITLIQKHQVSENDMQAYADGQKVPAGVQARLRLVTRDLDAFQRPLLTGWLKRLPE